MYWVARNHAYSNTKLFFGRKEFFWYFIVHTEQFLFSQLVRLLRAVLNNLAVSAWHLAGKVSGFAAGMKWHLKTKHAK